MERTRQRSMSIEQRNIIIEYSAQNGQYMHHEMLYKTASVALLPPNHVYGSRY